MTQTEVTVCGPTVWGQWIRQGRSGIVTGSAFGGISVRMNEDDKTLTFPVESLKTRAATGEIIFDEEPANAG